MAKVLTVKTIQSVKPSSTRQEIADGGLPGLYLIVQSSGIRSWAVRYRYDGKPKKFTIGGYPRYGLAEARQMAGAALRAVSEGCDPSADKKLAEAATATRVQDINDVLDEFVTRHIEARNRPSTIVEHKRLIDREIRPMWGDRPLESITRKDVLILLDQVVDRGSTIIANRLFALLRKLFNWALERDLVHASPLANMKLPSQETSRDRVLTEIEVGLVWKATEQMGFPFGTLYRLLLLLGQRRDEVASARWSEFQFYGEKSTWIIPKERAKNGKAHVVPLPTVVTEMLEKLPRISSERNYVFTTNGQTPISGFSRAKNQLDSLMVKLANQAADDGGVSRSTVSLQPWRIHDLRRTCASGMAALGHPVHVVEAVLNHRSGSIKGVAAVYNRYDYAQEKRRALEDWAAVLTKHEG